MPTSTPVFSRHINKRLGVFLGAVILLMGGWYVATRKLRVVSDAVARMPIGSSRQQVEAWSAAEHLQIAAFDYPPEDPRHGRTLLASHQGAYYSFVFDQAGPRGKLLRKQMTKTPPPPPLGPPEDLNGP